MKKYIETKGIKPFNWFKALTADKISDKKWEQYESLAGDWVTCACGNQCDIIPRNIEGTPSDNILRKLGGVDGFYGAVSEKDKESALHFLEAIEHRSRYLIKKELEKLTTYDKA